jgi:hypothetical protein
VVRHDAVAQCGIEGRQWRQHVGPSLRMRANRVALRLRQIRVIMDDVEQRLVDLPHIVEQCHALDVALLERIQIRRVGEDQCITSDAPDVAAGFSIVGVDGAKQCLENGGRESFGGQPALSFAREEDSACRSQCEPEVTNHGSRGRKKRATRVG